MVKVPIQNLKFLVPSLILLTGAVLQGQNLATNGDFENGFSGWSNLSQGTSAATYSLETALPYQGVNSMKVVVATAGTNAWDAQSMGPSFATTVGTDYTMTFYAKAALANTDIRMVVQNASYLARSFSLTSQWAKYTWTFTAVETTPRLRIHYFEAGTFWIDNISVVPTASIPITLTITPEIRHQEMVGFGGALTWYRERVLTSPHTAAIKQLLFEDLGLDVIRFKNWYHPSDYPTNKSASDPASKELFDEAKAANPAVKMLLSSWSPPVSLKSNGSLNNGGTLASDANGYRYGDFAQYWVDALDRLGWEPDYLSFQNEPGYVATWNSCIFRPTQTSVNAGYAEASDAIYNAIKDRPNAPVMIGVEAENIGTATWSDWKNGTQVNSFREMNTPLLSRPYVGAHAYHTYNMQNESQIDGAIPQLNMIRDEFSDRPNFMTEYSNNNYDWLAAARVVHNTVVEANAAAYFYWTLVWEKSAGSMIGISSNGDYTVGPHYHMLKHYSKHVSNGHRRIEVSGSTSDVKISGFINPVGTEITLVVINNSSSPKEVGLVQNSMRARNSVAYQSVVGNYFQDMGAVDISQNQTLPAKSMTTYVVSLTPETRTWTGASGAAWDVNTSTNWLEGDQKFYQLDAVTFGDTGAGTVAVTGVLTPASITVNSASNYDFTAAAGNCIAGAGGLTKSGSGMLTISGTNSYTGGTAINGGTLVANRSTLGTGAVVINTGGTLYVNDQWVPCGANPYHVAERNIATLTINAGGTLRFDATNGFANGATNLHLNGGLVTGGPNNFLGDLFLFNGNEQITASGATTSTIAAVIGVTGNNNTITVDGGSTLIITGAIQNSDWYGNGSSSGGFIKVGSGTLTLSGTNSYTGSTTVNGGILALTSASLGDNSSVIIAAGAMLNLNFTGSDQIQSLTARTYPVGPMCPSSPAGSSPFYQIPRSPAPTPSPSPSRKERNPGSSAALRFPSHPHNRNQDNVPSTSRFFVAGLSFSATVSP